MKKLILILLVTILATGTGLYFRPSYPLVGQLNWWNVLTKGQFMGPVQGFLTKNFIDESFFYVMRFTAGGVIAGVILAMVTGKSSKGSSKKK